MFSIPVRIISEQPDSSFTCVDIAGFKEMGAENVAQVAKRVGEELEKSISRRGMILLRRSSRISIG